MFPRALYEPDVKSKAEVKTFKALESSLDNDWMAFHSAAWVVRDKAGPKDGEIDFVLVHPQHGVLCLEVKGGGLECRHGEWSRLEDGQRKRMSDPFQQAVDHTYALERKLGGLVGKAGERVNAGWAVVFPDISVHRLVLAPDAPQDLVIDRHGLEDLATSIDRVLAFHNGSKERLTAPGARGAEKLRDILAPEVRIEVPLAATFMDEYSELFTLTERQADLLRRHRRARRMAITGPAGSGKTVLAVKRAQELAGEGKDVLFVCFNTALAAHLKAKYDGSGIRFSGFHALSRWYIGKANMPWEPPSDETRTAFWKHEVPVALLDALEHVSDRFDAIFVDEAQDFETDWVVALMHLLRDPKESTMWLFLDDNQVVYDQRLEVPAEFLPFDLDTNCRNTQAIHREVMKAYQGEIEIQAIGPEGRTPQLYNVDDPPAAVRALIEQLVNEDEVPPQDIAVLSAHNIDDSEIARAGCGRFTFNKNPEPVGPQIRFSSIRGYKGLESPVVILCELEDTDERTRRQQLYVGLSRAQNHCAIVVPSAGRT